VKVQDKAQEDKLSFLYNEKLLDTLNNPELRDWQVWRF
jgi:hypothetical protein